MSRCADAGANEAECQTHWDKSRNAPAASAVPPALSAAERAELIRLRARDLAHSEILAELQAEREERTMAAQRKLAFGEVSRIGLKLTVDRLCEILAEPTADGLREMLAATPAQRRTGVPPAGAPPEEPEDRWLADPQAFRDHCQALATREGVEYEVAWARETNRLRGGHSQGGAR